MEKSQIGLIGLGVMGANLSRNIANHNFRISVYNRTTEVTDEFIKEHGNDFIVGTKELKEFVSSIEKPRKIIILVEAGKPVDMVIEGLIQSLEEGDIIIDGGNSNFHDTQRRFKEMKEKGIHFIGCGVSGGEEGALHGPSLMPGGSMESWNQIKEIFEAIAARDFNGGPCVTYIGDNGAGHYVKMVHNGIEYGVMQVMAEGYEMLRSLYNLDALKISEIFKNYNEGKLKSFLFEISVEVLSRKDEFNEGYLIDFILDRAAQKGTGAWTGMDAHERGIPVPSISDAVYARALSSQKDLRTRISKMYEKSIHERDISIDDFVKMLEDALYSGMLSTYAQGYSLIQAAAEEGNWDINLAEISRIWEGGCIIRANILNFIHKAYEKAGKNLHLFEIKEISEGLKETISNARKIAEIGLQNGIPIPSLASAISYYDAITSEKVSANFIQGLRDYFGAHTYERVDKEGSFHTQWINKATQ